MSAVTSRLGLARLLGPLLVAIWLAFPAVTSAPAPTSVRVALQGPTLPLRGSPKFTAIVDPASGVTRVVFEESPAGANRWSSVPFGGSATTSPYTATLNTAGTPGLPNGNYDIRALAQDSSGQTLGQAVLPDQTVANPTASASTTFVEMMNPGSPLSGTATLVAEPEVGLQPPDTVTFDLCAPSGVNCKPVGRVGPATTDGTTPVTDSSNNGATEYVANVDTSKFSDGTYRISVSGQDAGGDTFQGGTVSDIVIDNRAPTLSLQASGTLSGDATLNATAGDSGGSGVASVRFELAPAGTGNWTTAGVQNASPPSPQSSPYSTTFNTQQFADGSYDLRAIATDAAGNSTTSGVIPVTISNPGATPFSGLTVTDIQAPAAHLTMLGELPGPEHETWAVGQDTAPQAAGQLVVLRYTDDTGWQIVQVLQNANGKPFTTGIVRGAMAPNGDAWVVLWASGGQATVFHRPPNGSFELADQQTTSMLEQLLPSAVFSVRIGETAAGQVYGALFPQWSSAKAPTNPQQTVWTSQGPTQVNVATEYAVLNGNDSWSLQSVNPSDTSDVDPVSLPGDYIAPSNPTSIELQAGDVTGPGTGWAAIEVDYNGAAGAQSRTVLAHFDNNGWTFESTGLDALDSTGQFADGSPQAAARNSAGAPIGAPRVTPTALIADAQGGFVSANVASGAGSGTVVAEFDNSGTVVDSWCSDLPQSFGCGNPIDVDHPAAVPDSLVDPPGNQFGVSLANGTLNVFTGGAWQSTPATGFQRSGNSASIVFADRTDGWIAGANSQGKVSATAPTPPLASWPEPNRNPLLSVALPPGPSTTDTPGALAVGLNGTALHYDSSAGWQVDGTPVQTHHLALDGVAFVSSSVAFAVGQGGTILRWNGNKWSADPESNKLVPSSTLNAVAFGSNGQGWAVGSNGTIIHYDGTAWSTEQVDPADSTANIGSVAIAGGNVFAVAAGNLIERKPGGGWERVPNSQLPTPAPPPGSLELVSGLPDGGLVVAGKSLLMTRTSSSDPFQYSPAIFNGIPVALAAYRNAAGALRAFVSAAPTVAESGGNGGAGLASNGTGGFPAGDGDLLVQTDSGFNDLSQDTPPTSVASAAGDGTVHQDPVLAVAASPDGSHAWAVGGYAGTHAADGVGTDQTLQSRSQAWLTSSIWRYDAGGSVNPPAEEQNAVSLPASPGTVNFAYLSSALCKTQCSAVHDAQPDINVQTAAGEIATFAQQPGGPAFAMFGGNARGPIEDSGTQSSETTDLAHFPQWLAPLAGLPTYAAYGPLDSVAGAPDPALPWAQAFAGAPQPFGPASPESAPNGSTITPQGGGDPTGQVSKYYAFDVHGPDGSTLRAIVLNNSAGSLEDSAPGQNQDGWLLNQLSSAQGAGIPVVVFAARPLDSEDIGAATDADSVAAQLMSSGAQVVAVFTTAGGQDQGWQNQPDRITEIPANAPAGATQIPEYEGATMTYQQNGNNGVLWYDVSVDTQSGAVTVDAVPVIGSLALEPLDGLTAPRSSTLQFQAIGRRPPATIATVPGDPTFPGFGQYVSIPASVSPGSIGPTYAFKSSDPIVGNFVAASASGSSVPKLTADGKTTPSSQSGLFCAFNQGTTTVTVTSGLMASSLPVTVQPGGFGPPCGTVPGGKTNNVIKIQGATITKVGSNGPAPPPVQPKLTPSHNVTPKIKLPFKQPPARQPAPKAPAPKPAAPPPRPQPAPQQQPQPQPKPQPPPAAVKQPVPSPPPPVVHHAPPPVPVHHPVPQQPFIASPSSNPTIGVVITPLLLPPLTPVPPGGATVPAQSTARREEKAKKEASQSAYVTRPAGESVPGWFYPAVGLLTLASLLLIAGGVRPGPKRAPAYAFVRETLDPSNRHVR